VAAVQRRSLTPSTSSSRPSDLVMQPCEISYLYRLWNTHTNYKRNIFFMFVITNTVTVRIFQDITGKFISLQPKSILVKCMHKIVFPNCILYNVDLLLD
jgi:hypothetical protein